MPQRLAMTAAFVLPLLGFGPEASAQETATGHQPLELALKTGGKLLPRFHLRDGQSFIGRFIGLKDDVITIRRPSGGLRSIMVADIQTLEIAAPGGEHVRGQLSVLADGGLGWAPGELGISTNQTVASANTDLPSTEAGGPLIKLAPGETDETSALETAALDAGTEPAAEFGGTRTIAINPESMTTAPDSAGTDGVAEPLDPLHLSVSTGEASESETVMYFRFKLSEPARQTIVIIYTLLNGSATAGDDFKHRQGAVVFDSGQQEAALAIEIVDDGAVEAVESFELFVTGDPNAVTIDHRTAEAIIHDNDA